MTKLAIEPWTFYDAAGHCFTLADHLNNAVDAAQQNLASTGRMSGSYDSGIAWGRSYDEKARHGLETARDVVEALHNYGEVLTRSGFNYEVADHYANLDAGAPPTMRQIPPPPRVSPVRLPTATGGDSTGLLDDFVGLVDKIGVPVPDGDTDKLGDAASAWRTLARTQLTSLHQVADGFGETDAPDAEFIEEDLRELAEAIDDVLGLPSELATICDAYLSALTELRKTITDILRELAIELAVDAAIMIAASFVTFGIGAVAGTAKVGLTITKFAKLIAEAIGGWKAVKKIEHGADAVRDIEKAKRSAERLKGLGKKELDAGRAEKAPKVPGAPAELPKFEANQFDNPSKSLYHFNKHGADFGSRTEQEYIDSASEFLQKAEVNNYPTKLDPDGRIRVYNPDTNTFGAFEPDGTIITYYKPSSPGYWERQKGVDVKWAE